MRHYANEHGDLWAATEGAHGDIVIEPLDWPTTRVGEYREYLTDLLGNPRRARC